MSPSWVWNRLLLTNTKLLCHLIISFTTFHFKGAAWTVNNFFCKLHSSFFYELQILKCTAVKPVTKAQLSKLQKIKLRCWTLKQSLRIWKNSCVSSWIQLQWEVSHLWVEVKALGHTVRCALEISNFYEWEKRRKMLRVHCKIVGLVL